MGFEDSHVIEDSHIVHGTRGDVGKASTSSKLKKLWVDAKKAGAHLSLKAFARKLKAEGDSLAEDWFSHKLGALNETRSNKNQARVQLERSATKSSRSKLKK
jgi:hypothetical protein